LITDLEETEARKDCAGEGQPQFNRPTDRRRENNGQNKNCIKLHEAKWQLEFMGGKYDCAGEDQQQL
jgi:hypothetical protein